MPIQLKLKTKIKINGQEYNSPDEMPADVRSLYEKALASRGSASPNIQVKTNSKIRFNGQTFNSIDEMPADIRKIYESIMAAVDKNGDGIPDTLQKDGASAMEPSAPLLPPQDQVISASKTSPRIILLGIAIILVLLLIGALVLLTLRMY